LIRTARGVVFPEATNNAVGAINSAELSVTYGVQIPGETVAITALTVQPGQSVTAADLSEVIGNMGVGSPPDIVHVVSDLPLSASYRPTVSALRAEGLPKPSRNSWYFDADTGEYKRFTAAVRSKMLGSAGSRS